MDSTSFIGANILDGVSLNILSDFEINKIHEASLEVLNNTGVYFENDEALEVLHSVGCRVDKKEKVVRIPSYLAEEAVASIPTKITLGGRDPKNDHVMGGTSLSFSAFGEATTVHDPYSLQIRPSTKMDVAAASRIQHSLDIAHTTQRSVSSLDVDPKGI